MKVELILVAVDFSPVSNAVYAVAEEMAAHLGARVLVLNVTELEVDYVGMAPPQAYMIGEESVRKAAEARLAAAREEFVAAGVSVEVLHRWGPPVGTILEEVERTGAGLVILGSHGHGALFNLLVGSVAEGVLRHSRVPVVVVPPSAKAAQPAQELAGAGAGAESGVGAGKNS
jgi:nucleotide-binding universal stress UspA family protein